MQTRAVRRRSRRPFRSLSPSFSSLSDAWVYFYFTSSTGCPQTARSSLIHIELGFSRLKGHVVRSQHIEISRRWIRSFARSSKLDFWGSTVFEPYATSADATCERGCHGCRGSDESGRYLDRFDVSLQNFSFRGAQGTGNDTAVLSSNPHSAWRSRSQCRS